MADTDQKTTCASCRCEVQRHEHKPYWDHTEPCIAGDETDFYRQVYGVPA